MTVLRERLPEILIEAGSVVFALLLALAANDWRDAHQRRELGEQARASLLAEVGANRQELARTLAENQAELDDLAARLAPARQDTSRSMRWSMSLAQLSSASWRTAQATQAASGIPFAALLPISRVYETQDIYTREQLVLLDRVTEMQEPTPAASRRFQSQLGVLESIGRGLDSQYVELLRKEPAPR